MRVSPPTSLFCFYRYFANRICQHDGSHGLTVTLNRDAEPKKKQNYVTFGGVWCSMNLQENSKSYPAFENWWLVQMNFLLGPGLFSGAFAVSLKECKLNFLLKSWTPSSVALSQFRSWCTFFCLRFCSFMFFIHHLLGVRNVVFFEESNWNKMVLQSQVHILLSVKKGMELVIPTRTMFHPIHGTGIFLPIHEWLIFMVNLGKYPWIL